MSIGTVVGLVLVTAIIISIGYLVSKADKRRKTHQNAASTAKKAEAAANRASWEKWRKK